MEQARSGEPDARGVPIAEVSAVLGVPMPTMRSWEIRYGVPTLDRGSGRHRRYRPHEVHAIRLMRDEIARGQPAALAARSVLDLLAVQGEAGRLIGNVLVASGAKDLAGIQAGLDEAVTTLGLAGCLDDVLLPAMRQIGVWWAAGHCDFVQEQSTTEAVRGWLDRRSAYAPKPARPQPILLACGPSDLHTVGLEAMALLLRDRRWACRVLGARTPTATLVTAAMATSPAAVVVVSHLSSGRQRAVASIQAIRQLGVPIFYAGNAFSTTRSRRGVGGTFLGTRIGPACQQLVTAIEVDRTTR